MQYKSSSGFGTAIHFFNMKPSVLDKPYFGSNFIYLNALKTKYGEIVFSRTIFFTVKHNEDGFYAQNKELNVFAYGATALALYEDMYDEILEQWTLYANEVDDDMTLDAQKIKNNLRELVVLKESIVRHA